MTKETKFTVLFILIIIIGAFVVAYFGGEECSVRECELETETSGYWYENQVW